MPDDRTSHVARAQPEGGTVVPMGDRALINRAALGMFLHPAECGQVNRAELFAGYEQILESSYGRITWSQVAALCRRMGEIKQPGVSLEEIGAAFQDSQQVAGILSVVRFIASPRALYEIVLKWAGPKLMPFIEVQIEPLADGRIHVIERLVPELEDCDEFWALSVGGLRGMPAVLGLPHSQVESQRVPRGIECYVLPPDSGTLWSRAWRWLRARFATDEMIKELGDQRSQLNARNAELESMYRVVDEQRRAAEAALVVKAQFLATMSHELRTPLNGIFGCSTVMRSDGDDAGAREELLDLLDHSANNLLRLVEDILDFSQLEAGDVVARAELFDLRTMLDHVITEQRRQTRGGEASIALIVADGVPSCYEADHHLIRAVLRQLLSNAIKFGQNQPVQLEVTCRDSVLELAVVDHGIGMSPEVYEKIFETFVQVDSSSSRKFGGTGLGLALARKLAKVIDAKLSVESELGKGSRFCLHVPVHVALTNDLGHLPDDDPLVQAIARAKANNGRVSVLIVEDNDINRTVLARTLASMGCSVTEAHNGVEGVEQAKRGGFDIVLMDCEMPQMNGYDATRAIRDLPPPLGDMPIVATTAYISMQDQHRCMVSGMNEVKAKPLTREELKVTLSDHIPRFEERCQEAEGGEAPKKAA